MDANNVPVPAAPQSGAGTTVAVNRAVAKSGRSTGLTCSTVDSINTNTSVDYTVNCDGTGKMFTIQYTNQIDVLGGDFSGQGDSGSLIVTQDTAAPVALLYAGSDTDTVGNPVADVLNFFKSGSNSVTFVGGAAHTRWLAARCRTRRNPRRPWCRVRFRLEVVQKAAVTRDAHVTGTAGTSGSAGCGRGTSYDNPKEPAILLFVTQGSRGQICPRRWTAFEHESWKLRCLPSAERFRRRKAMLEKSAAAPQLVYAVPDTEIARAQVVHTAHVGSLMKQAGVQGVGIGSSIDSPGEAALMIFTIRGVPHDPIPAVIDGLRTRVRESSRFRAGTTGREVPRSCKVAPAKAGANNAAREHSSGNVS